MASSSRPPSVEGRIPTQDSDAALLKERLTEDLYCAIFQNTGITLHDLVDGPPCYDVEVAKMRVKHRHQNVVRTTLEAMYTVDEDIDFVALKAFDPESNYQSICDELEQLAKSSESTRGKIKIAGIKGMIHGLNGDLNEARESLSWSVSNLNIDQHANLKEDDINFIDNYGYLFVSSLGLVLMHQRNFQNAVVYYKEVLKPTLCASGHALYPILLFGLGISYMAIGGISQGQAIEPLLECTKLKKNTGEPLFDWTLRRYAFWRAAKAAFYIGDILTVQDILKEVLLLDKKALELRYEPAPIPNLMKASIFLQIGLEDIGKRCFFEGEETKQEKMQIWKRCYNMTVCIALLLNCRQQDQLPGIVPDTNNPLAFLASVLCVLAKSCDDEKKYVLYELVAKILHHKNLEVAQGLLARLKFYIHNSMEVPAQSLVVSIDPYILDYFEDEEVCDGWEIAKGELASEFNDNYAAKIALPDQCPEDMDDAALWMDVNNMAFADNYPVDRKERYRSILVKTDNSLNNLPAMRRALERDRRTIAKDKGDCYEQAFRTWRASCFMFLDDLDSLRTEVDACASLYASLKNSKLGKESLRLYVQVQLYLAQTLMNRKDSDAANRYIQIAEEMLCSSEQNTILAIKTIKTAFLETEGKWMEAVEMARDAARFAIILQRSHCDVNTHHKSWVAFFSRHLQRPFWQLERLYLWRLKRPALGLLWAERGKMRLFMHQIQNHSALNQPDCATSYNPSLDELDECDTALMTLIHYTVSTLGVGTAVIEYSCNIELGVLHTYVIRGESGEIFTSICDLNVWFKENEPGEQLEHVICEARNGILNSDSANALKYLSILHALLLKDILQYLGDCDLLVFCPHGSLALVPFAALYDDSQSQFLIQSRSKGVSVTPSIQALYHCLHRQHTFEKKRETNDLSVNIESPFIAGNPKPMGLRLSQLPHSELEAVEVASYFSYTKSFSHLKACVGEAMTKEAVLNGLSRSPVVLLSTHGMVDDERGHPHGCLVLQAPHRKSTTEPPVPRRLKDQLKKIAESPQVLTAAEIAGIEGGISAGGLVVLSACSTGIGQVTKEGIFGLGRAVLQAGAATAVLTLWDVNDECTKDCITSLFYKLLIGEPRGRTVSECLASIMQTLISRKFPIKFWAPLLVVGSPVFRFTSFHPWEWDMRPRLDRCSSCCQFCEKKSIV